MEDVRLLDVSGEGLSASRLSLVEGEERATSLESIRQIRLPWHVHHRPPETVASRARLGASTLMPDQKIWTA
jgi:hypothetical protein